MLMVGGPLGELVQWSDIISSLYILGHDLTVISEVEQLSRLLMHSSPLFHKFIAILFIFHQASYMLQKFAVLELDTFSEKFSPYLLLC